MKVRCIKGFSADGKDAFIKDKIYEVYEFENKKLKHRYFIVSELNENFYFDSIEQFNIMFKTQIEEVKEEKPTPFKMLLDFYNLEVEERFLVNGFKVHFDEKGMLLDENNDLTGGILNGLIMVTEKVEKLPWKPKNNELVFCVDNDGEVYELNFLRENHRDLAMLKCGWLFKTYEEAEANKERVLKEYEELLK